MRESVFHFKQFAVRQKDSAQKVGTDSTVLGAWVSAMDAESILDIGTGTGILALMMAQKSHAKIVAIEPDEAAFLEAGFNVNQSPFKGRIEVKKLSLQEYLQANTIGFDLIVCNPPYYPDDQHFQMLKGSRQLARQTSSLSFGELLQGIHQLLNEQGEAWLVLPIRESEMLASLIPEFDLELHTRVEILHQENALPKRVLLGLRKSLKSDESQVRIEKLILYQEDRLPTREFYRISKDFLLWKNVTE